jgi:D-mannonate dehydratase
MGRLCQTVHYYLDRVITSTSAGKIDYKVHPNLIPFPLRNLQRLQQTCESLMFCLDPLTTVASSHILCYLFFHNIPPEILLQVLVHFLTIRVCRIRCLMSFLENQFSNRGDVGNAQSIFQPYHSCIFTEILAFSIYDQLPDLVDFLIILLTLPDVLL